MVIIVVIGLNIIT